MKGTVGVQGISARSIRFPSSLEIAGFINWLEQEKIEYNEEFARRDWNYIKINIYAEIGNAKWGKNISYKIKSLYDTQMIESINYLK